MRGNRLTSLPEELRPETSYEYGLPDESYPMTMSEMEADMAMRRRNRNVLVLADRGKRDEYGGVTKVRRPPLLAGRRWAFLEKW